MLPKKSQDQEKPTLEMDAMEGSLDWNLDGVWRDEWQMSSPWGTTFQEPVRRI